MLEVFVKTAFAAWKIILEHSCIVWTPKGYCFDTAVE